jgi:hypothetical protein
MRQRILADLDDDFTKKTQQILALEREIAGYLVQTPYVLLMAIPGINVVSAADLAGEMGPIEHYPHANAITGRAGLFPGRYQSDQVDQTRTMIRCGNKRLRDALMQIGDNLITCNDHFHGLAELWRARDIDPRLQRVRVVKQFSRLAFAMVAGRQVIPHRCCQTPDCLLHKLLRYMTRCPFSLSRLVNVTETGQVVYSPARSRRVPRAPVPARRCAPAGRTAPASKVSGSGTCLPSGVYVCFVRWTVIRL